MNDSQRLRHVTPKQHVKPTLNRRQDISSHHIILRKGTFVAFSVAFSILSLWATASIWYVIFRDDLVTRLLVQQTEMQYSYEDQVGILRTKLDRLATRKLVEQDGIEGRMSELVSRQVQLESRSAMLVSLASFVDSSAKPSVNINRTPASSRATNVMVPVPVIPDNSNSYTPSSKPVPIHDFLDPQTTGTIKKDEKSSGSLKTGLNLRSSMPPEEHIKTIETSLQKVELAQLQTLDGIQSQAQLSASKIRSVISETGLDPDHLNVPVQRNIGGPLVAMPSSSTALNAHTGPFETMVQRTQSSLLMLDKMRRAVNILPFARPVSHDADISSGFGYRVDPFTRGGAMHTGLDFRAETGAPVQAAASGQVISAGWTGGYGNMVEVQHSNGVSTRYAHLSQILVSEGDQLQTGALVGRVGSTGRSTGPHLHYETRLDGEAIDPQRFLKAGQKLALSVGKL